MEQNKMIERTIQISEEKLKEYKNLFFWFLTEPVQKEGYLDGYTTGIISAFNFLGVWDLFAKNEDAKNLPMNIKQQIKDDEGL